MNFHIYMILQALNTYGIYKDLTAMKIVGAIYEYVHGEYISYVL